MHGGTGKRLAWTLAIVAAWGANSAARAQEPSTPPLNNGPEYYAAAQDAAVAPPVQGQFVSEYAPQPGADLAKRVTELEAALKKMDDKAKADKEKAASKPSVTVFGRLYVDTVAFGQNAQSRAVYGDAKNSTYFRPARIGAQGDMFEVMSYKWEMDFASRDPQDLSLIAFRDVYIQANDLPLLGHARVGHFKEPLSLEELTSSRFITFMERSLSNTFIPAFDTGVMAFDNSENERVTWQLGVFAAGQDTPPYVTEDSTLSGDGAAGCVRTTWTPWYDEASAGRGLLHLGLGYRYNDLYSSTQRVRARPEVAVGPYVVDTRIGAVDTLTGVESVQNVVPEIAFLYGPFSVQAEYMAAQYTRTAGLTNPMFRGGYVFASYFLTGENRGYDRKMGRFDRVKPFTNFFRVRTTDGCVETGRGAWEVAYRYSWIDLDEGGILGGIAADHTVGLNWYLNPYTRMMLNYVHSDDSPQNNGPNTYIDAIMMRAQVDF